MNTTTETTTLKTTNIVLTAYQDDFYCKRENEVLFNSYAQDVYEYSKEIEKEIPHNYINKHKIESKVRTKMIDWMIEVLYSYSCNTPTIFLSIDIMDNYLHKTDLILSNNDIHLIGIVSIYIASKMEDIVPLRMNHIVESMGYDKYTSEQVKLVELDILQTLNFDLIIISSYEFSQTYIYDFYYNNKKKIESLKMNKLLDMLEWTTFYLCKLIAHFDEFVGYKYDTINTRNSLKSIACIIVSYDIIRSNREVDDKTHKLIKDWMIFIMEESGYYSINVNEVYEKIIKYYSDYIKIKNINFNLDRTHKLYFK